MKRKIAPNPARLTVKALPSSRHETARCRRDLGVSAPEGARGGAIVQKALDDFIEHDRSLPLGSLRPLRQVRRRSEQANADFLIAFTQGNFYFTVRALKPNAEDHLTVIHNRKALSFI